MNKKWSYSVSFVFLYKLRHVLHLVIDSNNRCVLKGKEMWDKKRDYFNFLEAYEKEKRRAQTKEIFKSVQCHSFSFIGKVGLKDDEKEGTSNLSK